MGKIANVIEVKNHKGQVAVHGEIWQAETTGNLHKGDKAKIIGMNGLKLLIRKADQEDDAMKK